VTRLVVHRRLGTRLGTLAAIFSATVIFAACSNEHACSHPKSRPLADGETTILHVVVDDSHHVVTGLDVNASFYSMPSQPMTPLPGGGATGSTVVAPPGGYDAQITRQGSSVIMTLQGSAIPLAGPLYCY
jgi:hypothetical protein